MAISIKSPAVECLAREAAALAGEGLTETIRHALEDRLVRLKGRRTGVNVEEEIMAISRRCAALPDIDTRAPEAILGYNSDGVFGGC